MKKSELKAFIEQHQDFIFDNQQISQLQAIYSRLDSLQDNDDLPEDERLLLANISNNSMPQIETAAEDKSFADLQKALSEDDDFLLKRWLISHPVIDDDTLHFIERELVARINQGHFAAVDLILSADHFQIRDLVIHHLASDQSGIILLKHLIAKGYKHLEIQTLVKAGIDIYKPFEGESCFDSAIKKDDHITIAIMLCHGRKGTVQEMTFALHLAYKYNKTLFFDGLMKRGADFKLRNARGRNALNYVFKGASIAWRESFSADSIKHRLQQLDAIIFFLNQTSDFDLNNPKDYKDFSRFLYCLSEGLKTIHPYQGNEFKERLATILTELILFDKLSCRTEITDSNGASRPLAGILKTVDTQLADELKEVEENKGIIRYQRSANLRPNFFNKTNLQKIMDKESQNCPQAALKSICEIKFSL